MSSPPPSAPAQAGPRLMLRLSAETGVREALALLDAGDVAAVVLTGAPPRALVDTLQSAGAAVLAEGTEPRLAAGLDGLHVTAAPALAAALKALKPDAIVGAGGLATRHAAMEAGESGADYVLLDAGDDDFTRTCEFVAWWADLFEVPCVAGAASLAQAELLAAAGADFILLGDAMATPQAIAAVAAHLAGADDAP